MTKVQATLMKHAKKLKNWPLVVKLALIASVENNKNVYLPNAFDLVSDVMTRHQFDGHLGALNKAGFYFPAQSREYAGYFGSIA